MPLASEGETMAAIATDLETGTIGTPPSQEDAFLACTNDQHASQGASDFKDGAICPDDGPVLIFEAPSRTCLDSIAETAATALPETRYEWSTSWMFDLKK